MGGEGGGGVKSTGQKISMTNNKEKRGLIIDMIKMTLFLKALYDVSWPCTCVSSPCTLILLLYHCLVHLYLNLTDVYIS